MTNIALSLGAALIAFGPLMAVFSSIVYSKAQLVIVVTSAAFFFLLSTVVASMFWWVFHFVGMLGPLAGIVPGVLAQFAFRCWFVAVYHRVEKAIQQSLENQEMENEPPVPSNESVRQSGNRPGLNQQTQATEGNKSHWTEIAKLRLELNDAACGIAAGVGFGGMHAVLLYGTLLASEMTNNIGVLYQDSCPAMPSLAVSAMYCFCFSILDVFWMLMTFFGMRRRRMYHRGERPPPHVVREYEGKAGAYLGNTREGGNLALLSVLATHFVTSIFTTADFFNSGCVVSLPATGAMVLVVAYWFYAGMGKIYMPPEDDEVVSDSDYNQHDD
mmetsp:Transcript_4980/g.12390  ORF Transcript_4980/g.12390 Transcript_4980/m.12390 type:complete len:329 (+) Transcript_4980:94-1080(+)